MEQVVITVKFQKQAADLILPATVPLSVLLPILQETLIWPAGSTPSNKQYIVGKIRNLIMRPDETLAQVGASNGDILDLYLVTGSPPNHFTNLPPALPNAGPHLLVVETGAIFPCQDRSMLIGRSADRSINLTPFANSTSASRTHANLVRRGHSYWINDENSLNGTFVDGIKLNDREPVRLREGNQIQFGPDGPVLIFRQGARSG